MPMPPLQLCGVHIYFRKITKHNVPTAVVYIYTKYGPLRGGDGGVEFGHEPQEELAVEGLAQSGGLVVRLLHRLQHHRVRAVHLQSMRYAELYYYRMGIRERNTSSKYHAQPSRQTDMK